MSYRDTYAGGQNTGTFHLYGYAFGLNSTKVVKSITLPNNGNVVVIAMTVVP
jgi:hypothetical protein